MQVQLLTSEGYLYPFQLHRIEQRYSDVPETQLLTLTEDGFVVAKLAAWADRRAPRDLYDLGTRRSRTHQRGGHGTVPPYWSHRRIARPR